MSTPSRLRHDPAVFAAVIAEYAEGMRVKDIAARYRISRATVSTWTRRAGVNRGTTGYHGRCAGCHSDRAQADGLCRPCAAEIPLTGGQWVIDPRRRIQVWQEAS